MRHFTPAGRVLWSALSDIEPDWLVDVQKREKKAMTPAQRRGIVYEHGAHSYLEAVGDGFYLPAPWIKFGTVDPISNEVCKIARWCQPDGLYFDFSQALIAIVEIKFRHTSVAYKQIKELYQPVLEHLFVDPNNRRAGSVFSFCGVEVVRHFDPMTKFPEPFARRAHPFKALDKDRFYVHTWNGKNNALGRRALKEAQVA